MDILDNDTVSDLIETRNKGIKTVLATVIKIVEDFLEHNPDKLIIFRGNDERRQRLYRLVIARELHELQKKFKIFGGIEQEKAELFQINKAYQYFLIFKR